MSKIAHFLTFQYNEYPCTLSVTNSTLSDNSASSGGGISNDGSSTVTLTGTIVANSTGGSNCARPITDVGYNLDSNGSCSFTLSSDLNNMDPMLGALGDNGGPTQTMALLQGSPVIDWVNGCPATDQRGSGYPCPDNSPTETSCDIGAYKSSY